MKRQLSITVLALVFFPFLISIEASAQEKDTVQIKRKTLDFVGIWKMDLPEQKEKLDPADVSKVKDKSDSEIEKLWVEADSRVYVFDESGNYHFSSVIDGSFQETRGKWGLDAKEMILQLESDSGMIRYKVVQTPKKVMLMTMERSEKDFNKLYLRSLLQ